MKLNKKSPYFMVCVVLLVVLAVLFMFPLYWIVTGSVKEKGDILLKAGQAIQWVPRTTTGANYEKLLSNQVNWKLLGSSFRVPAAIKWLYNSVFISVMAMLLTCVTASLAGYVLAKKSFYGKAI
ncbi:MAG: carbohydrate ABC transporter permease, partial [Pygmaiobacter massiliensis]